jgi:hypothetical protein
MNTATSIDAHQSAIAVISAYTSAKRAEVTHGVQHSISGVEAEIEPSKPQHLSHQDIKSRTLAEAKQQIRAALINILIMAMQLLH